MKKTIIILLMFMLLIELAIALESNSTNYDANLYFGSGGYVESTATKRVGAGIGQTVIGQTLTTHEYIAQYGIFYINITYSFVSAPVIIDYPFGILIEDFGIEWVKINWT